MRKTVILAVMLLCVVSTATAQGRGRPWRRGPLTVEEFGAVPYGVREPSHLDCAIVYSPLGVTEGHDTYRYCRTSALMYPTASWLVDDSTAERELNYCQMLFDLAEVHRRQMQQEAMLLSGKTAYPRLLELTTAQLERETLELQLATDHGRDSAAVERVRVKNREWLNAHPGDRPVWTPRLFWRHYALDVGFLFPAGSLAEHYGVATGVRTFTYGLGWGRHGLYWQFGGGNVKCHDTVVDGYNYGGQDSRTDVSFGYGFTLLNRESFSLTPYVAYGSTQFLWRGGDSYTLGVMGRYHLHRWHRVTNAAKGKGRCNTVSVTGNLYMSYTEVGLEEDCRGLTIGLRLGLALTSRRERVEW